MKNKMIFALMLTVTTQIFAAPPSDEYRQKPAYTPIDKQNAKPVYPMSSISKDDLLRTVKENKQTLDDALKTILENLDKVSHNSQDELMSLARKVKPLVITLNDQEDRLKKDELTVELEKAVTDTTGDVVVIMRDIVDAVQSAKTAVRASIPRAEERSRVR